MPSTNSAEFWNNEYKKEGHFSLSAEPAEDLEKFTRWLLRNHGKAVLNPTARVLDLGCGNGRNVLFLAREFGCRGLGYDISQEGINQARRAAAILIKEIDAPVSLLKFEARSIAGTFPDIEDESCDIVLDMMTSHFLKSVERETLRAEVVRVLKPGGWFFFKTFCADNDLHAKRLLRESPSDEAGSYIHPKIGVSEHVWTEDEISEFFANDFEIHKVEKSHKHIMNGKAFKRRSIVVYLEKKW